MKHIEEKPENRYKALDEFFFCPCCHYPTLSERQTYEICSLCNWEDEGQDDHDADEVLGGPNKDYSLTEARENFKKYLTMYRPSDTHPFEMTTIKKPYITEVVLFDKVSIKKTIIEKYNYLMNLEEKEERKKIFKLIRQLEKQINTIN